MRIFVSSSFSDLVEHRTAAIRVLRQLGHEVLAMEDMVAGATAPLPKVMEMVDRAEAYVGIFAWRYGYVPPVIPPGLVMNGAVPGHTSITEYEYLRAKQRKLPIMAFLLDERTPWNPLLVDGFDRSRTDAPGNAEDIRKLRNELQQERVVSWFTTPSDLEARVSAAVTMAGLTSQLDVQSCTALNPDVGAPDDSAADAGIKEAILAASDQQHALKIDLSTTWWSTRLYLLASLAYRLTSARRILVVSSKPSLVPLAGQETLARDEQFVGQLSMPAVISIIGSKVEALRKYQGWIANRSRGYSDVSEEIAEILEGWREAFGPADPYNTEGQVKAVVTPELLRRWFGEQMLQQPVRIDDLRRASAVDLLRLLDYPNDYVPVLTLHRGEDEAQPAVERVDVVDKAALNARLAHNYLVELLDRARIS